MNFTEIHQSGFERVLRAQSEDASYHGIVAVHNTARGPAVGGIRMWPYAEPDAALQDALRLARAMSYKNAIAGLPFGGGKSVIVAVPAAQRTHLLQSHARLINRLSGSYIGAGDVGISPADVEYLTQLSPHVARAADAHLDSGYFTAVGLLAALRAAAQMTWHSEDLHNRYIVVQGCGKVGASLAALLQPTGARIAVTDINEQCAADVARAIGASMLDPDRALTEACDILAPCAIGPVITRSNVSTLAARVIAGGANCQLEADELSAVLAARGILYIPDFVANAGGVISGMATLANWPFQRVEQCIAETYQRVCDLVARAQRTGQTVLAAALERAHERLAG
ncbi:MAG: Glu/Leu/Phe/Val dehydrogenase dimerization domain-containing protein [Longimicrobiales bacterium]